MLPTIKTSGKKQVAAYARVSTSRELQLNSLQNQLEYYSERINSNPDWVFAGMFYDEGISGTSVRRRNGIKELVSLSKARKVDLILTKSISRFARNTADLLNLTRTLKEYGTEVIFEKENISSFSADGELMLSLMGVFAQTESESISSNILWRIQKDRESGISTPHYRVFGYDWINGGLTVKPSEAVIVERIYSLYELGHSGAAIANEINAAITEGRIPGSDCTRHFNSRAVYYILRNIVYTGDLLMGKYYTTSPVNGRIVENGGERDMYLVEDDHEAIIPRDRWNRIQEELKKRTGSKK